MYEFLKQMLVDVPIMWDGCCDEDKLEGEKTNNYFSGKK
jgi:hypothetical protein